MTREPYPLGELIARDGAVEYVRDRYLAANGYLHMLYTTEHFYIAEDDTYQPWLSVMGDRPPEVTEAFLRRYLENDRYIAVCTNSESVAAVIAAMMCFTYHEDFWVACLPAPAAGDDTDIRPATERDLPFIAQTYSRSGHDQLLRRIRAGQMWVAADGDTIKGYAGMHKDGSLGFEYVAPAFRRQGIGTRLQNFVAAHMRRNGLTPFVMISKDNEMGRQLQVRQGSRFASRLCYFFAKGPYELE